MVGPGGPYVDLTSLDHHHVEQHHALDATDRRMLAAHPDAARRDRAGRRFVRLVNHGNRRRENPHHAGHHREVRGLEGLNSVMHLRGHLDLTIFLHPVVLMNPVHRHDLLRCHDDDDDGGDADVDHHLPRIRRLNYLSLQLKDDHRLHRLQNLFRPN